MLQYLAVYVQLSYTFTVYQYTAFWYCVQMCSVRAIKGIQIDAARKPYMHVFINWNAAIFSCLCSAVL